MRRLHGPRWRPADKACLALAALYDGREITTIEGVTSDGGVGLHPLQRAFIEHDAFQCGYCTPGQIMSAIGLLSEGRARSTDEIREFMSGNLCPPRAGPMTASHRSPGTPDRRVKNGSAILDPPEASG